MKEIRTTNKFVAIVDDEDYEYLSQFKWRGQVTPSAIYALRDTEDGPLMMHRDIMKPTDDMEVDHKDFNGLHNFRSNLRVCTHSQNMMNRRPPKSNKTGYKGVFPDKGKFCAQIKKNGKKFHLGYFFDKKEAALAYDKKALELHGEFANLNFPQES